MENTEVAEKSVDVFEKMKKFLADAGFNTQVMPGTAENIIPQLLIATGNEDSHPVIQVMFVDDLLEASNIAKDPSTAYIVQFFSSIPFKESKETIEVYRLISVFNRVCPIGYFGLSESEGAFFRYSFLNKDKNIESPILMEVTQMIIFFIRRFSGKLLDFVTGSKTYEVILQEMETELSQIAK